MITEASAVRTEKHGKDPLTHFLIDIFVLACCSDFAAWDHHQLWENSAEKGWSSESSRGLSCPFQSSQLAFGPHWHPALVSNPSATKLPIWGPWVRPFNARLRSWVQLKCKWLWHQVQVSASTGGRNQVRWIESEIIAEGCGCQVPRWVCDGEIREKPVSHTRGLTRPGQQAAADFHSSSWEKTESKLWQNSKPTGCGWVFLVRIGLIKSRPSSFPMDEQLDDPDLNCCSQMTQ